MPDRITLLADIAGIVARSHDLGETLDNVVDLVAKRLDADVCSVYLIDTDLENLTLQASNGLARESVGQVRLALGEGLVGLAAQQRAPVAIEHAREHPKFRYFPETGEERFESLMAAPLIVRDIRIGVLVVQTLQPRRFEPGEIELLETCAKLIAPIVLNARLINLIDTSDAERARIARELTHTGLPETEPLPPPPGETNRLLRGMPTSPGIAIGEVYRLEDPLDLARVEYTPSGDPSAERRDLMSALAEARRELDDVRDEVSERFGPEFAAVFNTHIQILEDKGFVARLNEAVQESGNALRALRDVLNAYRATFDGIEDPYFRERGSDIEDVGLRVLSKLLGVRHHNVPLREGAIVVADNLLPAHFALLETERMGAIVSEHGGPTSHGAIFARSLEIPAVTGVAGLLEATRPGQTVIVDGVSGRVIVSPDETLLAEYERAQQRHALAVGHLDALRHRPAETRDGLRIALTANVGLLNDLRLIEQHGAEGIGLFRTELLALAHRGFPAEDDQERLYERVALALAPRPVTIRTLDLGGDKRLPSIGDRSEENPQLGWRSIRLSLAYPEQFKAQLRAILRASRRRNIRILLPMVSGLGELRRARELIEEAKREIESTGADFDAQIPVGIMVEVPSAALIAEALAQECDFFSVGTNDLTQYTLAVDRGNERVAHLYDPLHPAVLALVARAVRAAARARIPVSVCGEMAGNPLAVPLLIGLGISELSATASGVPVVKEIVRALDSGDTARDARRALEVGTAEEVHAIAAERLRSAGLLEHPDIGDRLRSLLRRDEDLNGGRRS